MNISPYIVPGLKKELTENLKVGNILKAVSEVTGFSYPQLMNISRKRNVVLARALCYYFLRRKGLYLTGIGKMFSKDHTTIIYGLKLLKDLLDTDDEVASEWYWEIKNKL